MKIQTILSLAMATVALFASCSSDEILDVPVDKTIQFSGAFVDNSTRADDPSITTDDLDAFNVYGWVAKDGSSAMIFDNEPVTKGTDNAWTYTNTQYWIEGGSYTFSAIKGYTAGEGTLIIDDNGQRATSPTIESFKSNGTTDLIYAEATATGAASGNSAVAFTFQHQLAKVKFSFLNKTASSASIDAKITDITLTGAYETGTVVLSNTQHGASWSDLNGTLSLDFGNAGTKNEGTETESVANIGKTTATSSDNELLLIPTESSHSYTVQFTTEIFWNGVSIKKDIKRTATITQELKAGYAYNFTAELDANNIDPDNALQPITFTASVESWEDKTTTPLTTFTKVEEKTQDGQDN